MDQPIIDVENELFNILINCYFLVLDSPKLALVLSENNPIYLDTILSSIKEFKTYLFQTILQVMVKINLLCTPFFQTKISHK